MNKNTTGKLSDTQPMDINWEQQRVLANPLRSRIVALLFEKPMTSKQVADLLEKNPGTIYYHIKQLEKNDILEIDHTNTEKGIIEKFYRSKAVIFKNSEAEKSANVVDEVNISIFMSDDLLEELNHELRELFFKYGQLSFNERTSKEQNPYSLSYSIKKNEDSNQE
ncbi:ArsR/SmtB family transcription factor [Enterococcus durans]|uniref:ArsR/SmtB family transcription factor n=1 Tax=Enterococcus durans TaxID=53345 RepID=UPI0039A475A9